MWKSLPAPPLAVEYWRLPKDALMRDVILAIRADEAHHRLVNHTLGSMDSKDKNPFKPGQQAENNILQLGVIAFIYFDKPF